MTKLNEDLLHDCHIWPVAFRNRETWHGMETSDFINYFLDTLILYMFFTQKYVFRGELTDVCAKMESLMDPSIPDNISASVAVLAERTLR